MESIESSTESFAQEHPVLLIGAAIIGGAALGAILGGRPREEEHRRASLLGRVVRFAVRTAAITAARRALFAVLEGEEEAYAELSEEGSPEPPAAAMPGQHH